MKNKLLKWANDLGQGIALLLMFFTLEPIVNSEKYSTGMCISLIVMWILYDIYIYNSIFIVQKEKEKEKEHYWKYIKNADKKLNIELSYKEKFENLEEYIENYFNK